MPIKVSGHAYVGSIEARRAWRCVLADDCHNIGCSPVGLPLVLECDVRWCLAGKSSAFSGVFVWKTETAGILFLKRAPAVPLPGFNHHRRTGRNRNQPKMSHIVALEATRGLEPLTCHRLASAATEVLVPLLPIRESGQLGVAEPA